tara:strand:+ start:2077 stop:3777 length:1701 start_codon:yes stop_codon:yes gene_type:complete
MASKKFYASFVGMRYFGLAPDVFENPQGTVELEREEDNNYDPNAVLVMLDGEKVAHVDRESARTISKVLCREVDYKVSIREVFRAHVKVVIDFSLDKSVAIKLEDSWGSCAGIYSICVDEHVYVGQSTNVRSRIFQHWSDLNFNIHPNYRLQKYWNMSGSKNTSFDILAVVPEKLVDLEPQKEWMLQQEQKWIDNYRKKGVCLNIRDTDVNTPPSGISFQNGTLRDGTDYTISEDDVDTYGDGPKTDSLENQIHSAECIDIYDSFDEQSRKLSQSIVSQDSPVYSSTSDAKRGADVPRLEGLIEDVRILENELSILASKREEITKERVELEGIVSELFQEYEDIEDDLVILNGQKDELAEEVPKLRFDCSSLSAEKTKLIQDIETADEKLIEISKEYLLLSQYAKPAFEKEWKIIKERVQHEVEAEIKSFRTNRKVQDKTASISALENTEKKVFTKNDSAFEPNEDRAKIRSNKARGQRRRRHRAKENMVKYEQEKSKISENEKVTALPITDAPQTKSCRYNNTISGGSIPAGKVEFVCTSCRTKNVVDDEYLLTCSFCKKTRFSS